MSTLTDQLRSAEKALTKIDFILRQPLTNTYRAEQALADIAITLASYTDPDTPVPGRRARLKVDVERFPHFIAKAGATGVIVGPPTFPSVIVKGEIQLGVKMDEHISGCEEWHNIVWWFDKPYELRQRFAAEVELL